MLVVLGATTMWGALFYGSLSLADLHLGYLKFLCGPWGCLPQTAPLVSVHAMWLTCLFGVTWLARLSIRSLQSANLWGALLLATFVILLTYTSINLVRDWNPQYGATDVIKHAAFVIATATDFPIVQGAVCCVANFIACDRSRRIRQEVGHLF
jgi:hypothetical protein